MSNNNPECKQCAYNVPKTKGGLGRVCNGYTVPKYNRCPVWRINEVLTDKEDFRYHQGLIYPKKY